jgi:hypothetical protein
MADKKVVLVRFYPEADADLIAWLEDLAVGRGNDTLKAMLRAGILASQSVQVYPALPMPTTATATLDLASLQYALESFLPRIREIVDASLASANFAPIGGEIMVQDESTAFPDLLKGHLLGDEDA